MIQVRRLVVPAGHHGLEVRVSEVGVKICIIPIHDVWQVCLDVRAPRVLWDLVRHARSAHLRLLIVLNMTGIQIGGAKASSHGKGPNKCGIVTLSRNRVKFFSVGVCSTWAGKLARMRIIARKRATF